jgi:hypothetical protein
MTHATAPRLFVLSPYVHCWWRDHAGSKFGEDPSVASRNSRRDHADGRWMVRMTQRREHAREAEVFFPLAGTVRAGDVIASNAASSSSLRLQRDGLRLVATNYWS